MENKLLNVCKELEEFLIKNDFKHYEYIRTRGLVPDSPVSNDEVYEALKSIGFEKISYSKEDKFKNTCEFEDGVVYLCSNNVENIFKEIDPGIEFIPGKNVSLFFSKYRYDDDSDIIIHFEIYNKKETYFYENQRGCCPRLDNIPENVEKGITKIIEKYGFTQEK